MSEYIKREDVLSAIKEWEHINVEGYKKLCRKDKNLGNVFNIYITAHKLYIKLIEKFPDADVEEVRHGKNISSGKDGDWFRCSECNYAMRDYYSEDETIMPKNELQYCPNCGARMDKEEYV